MSKHMDRIMREAVAAGLLEPAASAPATVERHWSVLVFTALGAWLSALPLIALIVMLCSDHYEWIGVAFGVPILIGSVLVLRAGELPLFVEQLAVPGLLVGAALIAFQASGNLHSERAGVNAVLLVACLVAAPVRQAWIRTLLGAAIGVLGGASLSMPMSHGSAWTPAPLAWSVVAAAWLLMHAVQRALVLDGRSARTIAALEAVSAGMAAAALSGMIWASGRTFLLGAVFDPLHDSAAVAAGSGAMSGLSVALAIAGGAWLAYRWPVLRAAWYAALLGLAAALAWFVPLLGAALLVLCVCVESRRHVLATYAAFASLWMAGGLYYAAAWPLATKALLLGGVGIGLALLGRFAIAAPLAPAEPDPVPQTAPQTAPQPVPARSDRRIRAGFVLCGLLVLGVANLGIWQKESVIGAGSAVYVELAPVDPRSLMQGDYMRLAFRLPAPADGGAFAAAPQVIARVDERGVAQLLRFQDGRPLAKGEFPIDLVRRHGDLTLVSDAWYFKEGEGARWSKARYGEFRVAPDGKALLVGLRGPGLEKL